MPLLLIFLVALVYASVGHGGASGYLAVTALLGVAAMPMASSALVLNLLVAGTACVVFWRAGYGSSTLLWPFVLGAVPAAFIGGALPISSQTYQKLLALTLLVAAARLILPAAQDANAVIGPGLPIAVLVGAVIGFVSGIVGVGGGIFLSPLMILLRWATPKQTAAASAGFIVVNSAAGLAGRLMTGRFQVGPLLPLVAAAFAGGMVGSRLGANHFSSLWLRRVLAVALVIAGVKLVASHG